MTSYPIGIDLGTTNSLISVFENGEARLIPNANGDMMTPSVVGLGDDGNILVGEAARSRLLTAPNKTFALFKRTMGADRTFKLGRRSLKSEDLSALILRSLKQDAEDELSCSVTDVVISVPAYFNEIQRRAIKNACAIAELNPVRLINEPTAAAMAYGLHERDQETTFLVFDLGGGTFDVAILEIFEGVFEVRASAGDSNLGGEDFTKIIAEFFAGKLGYSLDAADINSQASLRHAAEQAKRALTSRDEVVVTISAKGAETSLSINRDVLEDISQTLIQRLRRPVERCLHDSNIALNEINRVLLVGGATRMQSIRSFAARTFGRLPEGHIDPDHVVALGAAVQAAFVAKDKALGDMVMTDVTAFSMGVGISRDTQNGRISGLYEPVIERNSTVPISREITIPVAEIGQTSAFVEVFQGEAPMVQDNLHLGSLNITLPYNDTMKELVTVRFTYDVSGLLEVEVKSTSQGNAEKIVIQGGAETLSETEIASRLKQLESLKVHPREEQENIAMLARLRENYEMALGPQRYTIQRLLTNFEEALTSQDKAFISRRRVAIGKELKSFEDGYVR